MPFISNSLSVGSQGGKGVIIMKKITWEFNNGEKITVEVEDELGEIIIESRREEENLERKERYHCFSYDAATYEGKDYGTTSLEEDFDNEVFEKSNYSVKRNILCGSIFCCTCIF